MTFQKTLLLTTAALALVTGVGSALAADPVTLTIDSWRPDDLSIWQDKILPVFMAAHPDIKVTFAPTASTEYNASLNTKLQGGRHHHLPAVRRLAGAVQSRPDRRSDCPARHGELRRRRQGRLVDR